MIQGINWLVMKNAHRILQIFVLISTMSMVLLGCGKKDDYIPKTYSWDEADIYEAEDQTMLGNAKVSDLLQGYSGTGYVDGIADEGDGVSFTITINEDGFYDFNFICASSGADYKENYVSLDGDNLGTISVQSAGFTDSLLERAYLTAGQHTVDVTKFWGWISLDMLQVKMSDEIDPHMYEVKRTLCNPNSNETTKRLYSYLCDEYGNHILSGQYSDGMFGLENVAIQNVTGSYPAILGLDLMEYTPSRVAYGSKGFSVDSAIGYWNQGGIVTFCWHWNAPEKYLRDPWWSGFYTDYTTIDLGKIMSGEDEEGHKLLMEDIDAIAEQLLILQENDVPILWRPLHEASGGWFWWGASGPEAYKQLYIEMYNKLTNEYGLNNLIWVWNGQDKDWYPGDEYVDIIGWDLYPGEHVYTPQTATFLEAAACTEENKIIVMSENGCVFDADTAFRDGSTWGFFCTWCDEFVLENPEFNKYGEKYTERQALINTYQDERVINREDLPDFSTYPITE